MHRLRGWLPLLGWFGSLAAGIVVFTALGDGPLEPPPLGTPSAWGAWAAERDGAVATVAILRLVVLALSWYLVAVTTVGLVARLTRAARLVRLADALSVPIVRHVLQGALGLTLAAGVVVSSSGAVPVAASRGGHEPSGSAVMATLVDDAGRADPTADPRTPPRLAVLDPPPAQDGARMIRVDDERGTARMVGLGPPGATSTDRSEPAEDAAADRDVTEDEHEVVTEDEHEVVAGEHLWSIAASHLSSALGRTPTDAEVVSHWERLIAANRDRLANPDDPDLIFPGQRLVVPTPVTGNDA